MTVKIAWHVAEKIKRYKDYKLTDKDYTATLVDDNFLAKRRHSSMFVLTSQPSMTFAKLRLTKQWYWDGPNPNDNNDEEEMEWTRDLPRIRFGSIYIDEAYCVKKRR